MERGEDFAGLPPPPEPPPAGQLSPAWRSIKEPTRPVPVYAFTMGAPRVARVVVPLTTLTITGAVLVYLNAFTRQVSAPFLPIWIAIAVPAVGLGWVHMFAGSNLRAGPRPVSARFQGLSLTDVLGGSKPRIATVVLSVAACVVAGSIANSRFPQPARTPGRCEAVLDQGGEQTCVDAAELHAYQAGNQASSAAWVSLFAIVSLGAAAATLDKHETG
jgi:hypothetical protein